MLAKISLYLHPYCNIFQKKHVSQEDKTTELKTYLYNTLPLDHPKNQENLPPNTFSLRVFDTIRAMMNNQGGIIVVGINETKIITAANKMGIFIDFKKAFKKP